MIEQVESIIGRTVSKIKKTYDKVLIEFTDGTGIVFESENNGEASCLTIKEKLNTMN